MRKSGVFLAAALAAASVASVATATAASQARAGAISAVPAGSSALTPVRGLGWGFNSPDAMVTSGGDLFVTNTRANSVTVLKASSGALVRVIS